MGIEENKQLVLDWVEALSAGDADRTCAFYTHDLRYFVVGDWPLGASSGATTWSRTAATSSRFSRAA